jgi:hypothetical protein
VTFTFPPEPAILRAAVEAAGRPPESEPLPLSQRPARDTLSERFARAFADLDLPELLHAFDPRLGQVPVLALGAPGTGRGTLVRYVHQLGPTQGGTLVELDCTGETDAEMLLQRIALAARHERSLHATSLWLRNAHRLRPAVQREAAGWIEYGLPWGAPRTRLLRWFGTAEARGLEPRLRRALGGLSVSIRPLRERTELLGGLANATAAAWCSAHGLPPRRLGDDVLEVFAEYPWPGNVRELEAVIAQSLAASSADPLGAGDLVLDGTPFVPVPATHFGTLLDEDDEIDEPAGAFAEPGQEESERTEDEIDDRFDELVTEPYDEEEESEEELPEAEILELPPFPRAGSTPGSVPEEDAFEPTPLPPGDPAEPGLDPRPAFLEPIEAGAPELDDEPVAAPPLLDSERRAVPEPPAPAADASEGRDGVDSPREDARGEGGLSLQRLAAAVGHEVRNPLTAVRTFAELLPERFDDADFRGHFSRMADESLGRVETVLERLEQLAAFPEPERRAVDVGALLREVLEKRRATIHGRRLVVLEELDRSNPTALCDPEQLRFAFEALIDKSLELVPERGDVYLASRRHEAGLRGEPSVRILLRYRGSESQASETAAAAAELSPAANALSFALADIVVRAQGGTLALDTSDRSETVVVVDLPS